MAHTLWHGGILIGETNFEGDGTGRARGGTRPHLAGVFRPTAHGRRLLPRLCGILSAGADLKDELLRRGLDPDDPPPESIHEVLETTSAGARILDVGRVLSEVELRAPSGAPMRVASMAFMDLAELGALTGRLDCGPTVDHQAVPPRVAEFIVSVTLREPMGPWTRNAPLQ